MRTANPPASITTPCSASPRWRGGLARLLLAAPLAAAAAPSFDAWHWAGTYKADLLHVSAPRLNTAVGNLSLSADADGAALFDWDDTALHAELLFDHGGKPNRRLGTTQGISNLEVVQNTGRIYATWVEREFKGSGTRVLFGLYDLNSEFYATEASGLLVQPSFGIGIDFSQSGRNGPSIFPNLGLSLRVRQAVGSEHYVQFAVIDGVPGDPAHPGRTVVHLSRDDGALLVGEWGWQEQDGNGPKDGHWGLGVWHYTRRSARFDGGAAEPNQGAYAVAQTRLTEASGAGAATGFVRAGAANRHVNAVDFAFDAGVQVKRPFGLPRLEAVTAGLAFARYGAASASNETTVEVGARWRWDGGPALQPWLQHIWRPGGRADAGATVIGLRLEWALAPAQR